MGKPAYEALYTRIRPELMKQVRDKAKAEERSVAATVSRLLTHALTCPHKVVHDEY